MFILTQCGKEHRRHNNILITVELWTFPVSAIIQNFNFSFKVKTQLFYTLNLYYLTLSVLRVTRPKRGQKTLLCSLKGHFANLHNEKYCVQSHALVLIERPFCLVPTEKQYVQSHANETVFRPISVLIWRFGITETFISAQNRSCRRKRSKIAKRVWKGLILA